MPILVKACWTGPNDGASGARRSVSPGRREAQQQTSQGSFWRFPLCLNPKLRRFDPKSSDFSSLSVETWLQHIQVKSLNQNLEN